MKLKYRHISAVKAAEKHLDKSNDIYLRIEHLANFHLFVYNNYGTYNNHISFYISWLSLKKKKSQPSKDPTPYSPDSPRNCQYWL